VTTCDADSKFHPRYLEALTYKFLNEKDPNACVFQVLPRKPFCIDRFSSIFHPSDGFRSSQQTLLGRQMFAADFQFKVIKLPYRLEELHNFSTRIVFSKSK
jgi:hypothetical protein